jgi:hypothetical protein
MYRAWVASRLPVGVEQWKAGNSNSLFLPFEFFFGGIFLFLKNKTHTTESTQHWPFWAADVFYGFMNTKKSLNGRNIFLIRLHPHLPFHLCPFGAFIHNHSIFPPFFSYNYL